MIIAVVLSPVILLNVLICSLVSGTADHNNTAVDLTFHGGAVSEQAPLEYRQYIEDMRGSFGELDVAVSEITPQMESGSIDSTRIKAIFYSLFFGAENLRIDYKAFRIASSPMRMLMVNKEAQHKYHTRTTAPLFRL